MSFKFDFTSIFRYSYFISKDSKNIFSIKDFDI